MKSMKFWGNPLAVFSFPIAALALTLSHCNAAPPDGEPKEPRLQELRVVEGKVKELTKNKPGDVDGWKLKGGGVVHFPPHVGRELGDSIEIGTMVRVLARSKSRPDGQDVMEALVIESDGRAFYITPPVPKLNAGPNANPPTPSRPQDLPKEPGMNATGVVAGFQTNKAGEVDGFALASDTSVIRFPPHLGKEVQAFVMIGNQVTVDGRRHVTPDGKIHLHADRITLGEKVFVVDRPATKPHGPNHHDEHKPKK